MVSRSRPNFVGVWLSDAGLKALKDWSKAAGMIQSDAIRKMLSHGVTCIDPAELRNPAESGDSGQ